MSSYRASARESSTYYHRQQQQATTKKSTSKYNSSKNTSDSMFELIKPYQVGSIGHEDRNAYSPTCSPAPTLLNNTNNSNKSGQPMKLMNNYQHHPLLHNNLGSEDENRTNSEPTPSPPPTPMFDRCRKTTIVSGGSNNANSGLNGPSACKSQVVIMTAKGESDQASSNSTKLNAQPVPPARRQKSPSRKVAHPSVLIAKSISPTTTMTMLTMSSTVMTTTITSTCATLSSQGSTTSTSALALSSTSPAVPTNQVATLARIIGNQPFALVLITLKDQNKSLVSEIEDIRIKLADSEAELKIVRCQMRTMSKEMEKMTLEMNRERLVDNDILNELAFYKEKMALAERELQTLVEKKEEALMTKADMQLKNDRLNEQLLAMMRSMTGNITQQAGGSGVDESLLNDMNALFLENCYLKEKVQTEEDERHLLTERLADYKSLVDRQQMQQSKGIVFGEGGKSKYYASSGGAPNSHLVKANGGDDQNRSPSSGGKHMPNHREIERLLNSDTIHSMEASKANMMYLYNLLEGVVEGTQSGRNLNTNHMRPNSNSYRSPPSPYRHQHYYPPPPRSPYRASSGNSAPLSPHLHRRHRSPGDRLDGVITPGTTNTSEPIGNSTAKENSEETSTECDEDDLTSTAISTPSTTARHSLSIERHLQALQADALADDSPTPTRGAPPSPPPPANNFVQSPPSPRHLHQNSSVSSGPGTSNISPFDRGSPYPPHKPPTSGLY